MKKKEYKKRYALGCAVADAAIKHHRRDALDLVNVIEFLRAAITQQDKDMQFTALALSETIYTEMERAKALYMASTQTEARH